MVDWLSGMNQSFEYYTVDPSTWMDVKRLTNVTSSTIVRDTTAETLGSATIDITEELPECYVRTYLVTVQNGLREKHALGTFLIQTPSTKFDGRIKTSSLDAYTPLLELKENQPPLGYSILKGENIMENAYRICREHVRAPVVSANSEETLYSDFVSNTNDTWATFLSDLVANAKYELDLDERGRILFSPKQDTASLQPIWTYTDDNSSILTSDISIEKDLYGIPNVVEVIYSGSKETYYSRIVNDDPNSPVSTVVRGREIVYRDLNPSSLGNPTQSQLDEYAKQLLKSLSTIECSIDYTHGYCPVRLRDCVRLNHRRFGLVGVNARVIRQSIDCSSGCQVSETAVYTRKLWER